MKKLYHKYTCEGCRALEWQAENNIYRCKLGHPLIQLVSPAHTRFSAKDPSIYSTEGNCEKPRTWLKLNDLLGITNADPVEFGDILYRPCKSYAGRQNFVVPSIVKEICEIDGEKYILSYDVLGAPWTDKLDSLGVCVFKTKKAAIERLDSIA